MRGASRSRRSVIVGDDEGDEEEQEGDEEGDEEEDDDEQTVRYRDLAVVFHGVGQQLLGRMRFVPSTKPQMRERSCCSQGYA